MGNLSLAQGIMQGTGYLFLPNHIGYGLRTPFSVKDLRSHFPYYTLNGRVFLAILPAERTGSWLR